MGVRDRDREEIRWVYRSLEEDVKRKKRTSTCLTRAKDETLVNI